jgi:hypothetical protein
LLEVLLHGGSHVGGWTAKQIHHAVLITFDLSDTVYRLNQPGHRQCSPLPLQMIDVHVPTTDGRELLLTRYTEPDAELRLLLDKLKLALPAQSPPKTTTAQIVRNPRRSEDL